ncbi:cupin-like domain-containing protein [Chitinophaga sp. 22321]|uniref:Cupin-like domain-containing protein n=1 Tax=Chitinophaga hostae TaxID=2831022 RepID=A0ABS5JA51_9BACT|nr:cupin-like domain-containing protein [Chitinophaga hostae]MBS0032093.1 cupin-like domain-containing protein [Chitinophaga hostae]
MDINLISARYPHVQAIQGRTPPLAEFNEAFGFSGQPVIFKDNFDSWGPAAKLWTEDYLRKHYGHVSENADRRMGKIKEKQAFLLSDYFDYIKEEKSTSSPPFYFKTQFHIQAALSQHYKTPDCFHCWYRLMPAEKRRYALSWIYIGAANTGSDLHLDLWNTSAWNAVISGKKLWFFFPPGQESSLYQGDVNVFSPDYETFPDYENASPLICIQEPGDVVYTPSGWWHAVLNVEAGISLTENFINETNYQQVYKYFRQTNNLRALESFEQIVAEGLKHQ